MLSKVTNAAHFLPTVESSVIADHQYEKVQTTPVCTCRISKKRAGEYRCRSSERRKQRFLQTVGSTQDSPLVMFVTLKVLIINTEAAGWVCMGSILLYIYRIIHCILVTCRACLGRA